MSQGEICQKCRCYLPPPVDEWSCKCEPPTVFLCKLDKSKCDHEWNNEGRNPTHCLKCGQSFTAYAFMEAP